MSEYVGNDANSNEISCAWKTSDPEYIAYHNEHWGRPVLDSQELFAKLCLDGQQAGLSWITILRKQANYEKAFHQFDPHKIIQMNDDDVQRLMQDKGIVRNKLKINSIIKNAKAYIEIEKSMPFSAYLWQFTHYQVIQNTCATSAEVAVTSSESDAMAKALKKAGFSFVGSTICYAFMQAVGMVNDHLTTCPCYAELLAQRELVDEQLQSLKAKV
ncbi:MAG: DNA-3-methyladenine glycosylase I [Glaciecola sp.]|jgi:DNA-3-methyladenine glycosylase I